MGRKNDGPRASNTKTPVYPSEFSSHHIASLLDSLQFSCLREYQGTILTSCAISTSSSQYLSLQSKLFKSSTMIGLASFLILCHHHQASAFLHPIHHTYSSVSATTRSITASSTNLYFKDENKKDPTGSIIQDHHDEAIIAERPLPDSFKNVSWYNDFAIQEINELEALGSTALLPDHVDVVKPSTLPLKDDDVDDTEKSINIEEHQVSITTPAERIIHEHNHVIYKPPLVQQSTTEATSSDLQQQQQTALIFLPGCFLNPIEYEKLALAIQTKSSPHRPTWIVIPKLVFNMATPLTVPRAVKECINALHTHGYPTTSTTKNKKSIFIGGHSLGGTFLPQILSNLNVEDRMSIAGKIQLGSFVVRSSRKDKEAMYRSIPRLTVAGDLDGLIRASRIAEDVQHHVLNPILARSGGGGDDGDGGNGMDADKGYEEKIRLDHCVVLIPGMVSTLLK